MVPNFRKCERTLCDFSCQPAVGGISSGDCAPECNSKADAFTDADAFARFYLDSHTFARTGLDSVSTSYCSGNPHSHVDSLANTGVYSNATDLNARRFSGSSSIRQSRY